MATDTEQREILAELRELKAEFAAVHKRLDTIDKTTKRTEHKTDRGFATVADTLAWQDLIQNLILYGVCFASVSVVTSIGVIRSEVCPKAPGWALHLIPFGNVICAGATDKPVANADPIVALRLAIIGQESGGNHTAMNASGSGATGLGQVMPENIAAWSSQCIGRSLTQDQFRDSPDLQIQIIDCKLKEYWNQVDGDDETRVRKVASMWYSGQSGKYDDPTPQSWNGNSYPSIRDYTLKVLERWKKELKNAPVSGGSIVSVALSWVGKEFNPGQTEQCMYFVREVLKQAGIAAGVTKAPIDGHTTGEGFASSLAGKDIGTWKTDVNQVQAGDIVFWFNTYGNFPDGTITHVGIAIGNGEVVDRPTASKPVQRRKIESIGRFAGAVTLKAAPTVSNGAKNNDKPATAQKAAIGGVPSSFVSVRSPNGLPCSGFAVSSDKVVTAKHCISDLQNTIVIPQSGDWLKGQVVATAEDAAIVQVDGASFTPAPLGTVPAAGDVVTSWGHPHGAAAIESAQIKITTNEGSVFAAAPAGDRRVVDGFSGGQVVDSAGRVIGFNSEANPAGMVKVQSIEVVKELLK